MDSESVRRIIYQQIPSDPDQFERWSDESYERISIRPDVELKGVAPSEPIRRFVDLPKLFDLLANRRLILPRLRELVAADPYECFARKSFSNLSADELRKRAMELEVFAPEVACGPAPHIAPTAEISSLQEYVDSLPKSKFDHDIKRMSHEELQRAVWRLEQERLKCDLVCSCWYKGTVESDAMWKIYAAQLGVCVVTTVERLVSAIQLQVPKIYAQYMRLGLSAVEYEDSSECGSKDPWLIKRKAFEHEKEVRLYCEVPYAFHSLFELQMDPSVLIEEIVISPFAAHWQMRSIAAAIRALLKEAGINGIKVRPSQHMNAPSVGWPDPSAALDASMMEDLERALLSRPTLRKT